MVSKKILVVDDEKEVLDLLEKKLLVNGFRVVKAASGKEAIDKARATGPSLILMDIVLPDFDGADVVKYLGEDSRTQNIPIIFLSGIVTEEEGKSKYSVNVGGQHYTAIPKPFKFEELLTEIKNVIG